ncbi:hypothetical protein VFPPC_16816 [Pochonia chlamydosporia 170]|uniref:Uncharacterized protein n=1 Tax=Pochonia chlamydosporia 170 TaxID=1380566 RepID=A0A179F443_METCM|nr:hypothetical protein VFPPC_16816 [Pochonia chlamydosporia 170]OAQ59953.1 hypothetical protein VFPPC_16816 [Pochonia chlamydosporia 170]
MCGISQTDKSLDRVERTCGQKLAPSLEEKATLGRHPASQAIALTIGPDVPGLAHHPAHVFSFHLRLVTVWLHREPNSRSGQRLGGQRRRGDARRVHG